VKDIVRRKNVRNVSLLDNLTRFVADNSGKVFSANSIAKYLRGSSLPVSANTVGEYMDALCDTYMIDRVKRYDIKGKRYFESIKKYYSVDIGLRNARLNFRQQELTHIMENIVYNHLRIFGYLVDVGVVEVREMKDGKQQQTQYEVDFIATNGQEKYYIQSAYRIDDEVKQEQELQSLKRIDDSFRKVVIVGDDIAPWTDENGIMYIGLFQFLQKGLQS
jgi:predicted AAA+ superfamily ATPase